MRTISRCLIPLMAAGCLALTAGTPATAAPADTGAAPKAAPAPLPDACDVDWTKLGLTGSDTLHEAIVACVEQYMERDLESWESWLQAPSKPPKEQENSTETEAETETGTGTAEAEKDWAGADVADWTGADVANWLGADAVDWLGADAVDWASDLACDLAEIFDEP
ncbi:hypothetical protein [Streptomyces albicerus]|uniref:hypothetical protein n=1 Tax=Streptomyces albicerus TaxID=2569859 RepID=UPI00124AFE18|nr:hypothetical protein [Streptomyces albicerus]